GRWASWEQGVLARVWEPEHCQRVLQARRDESNDDTRGADVVRGGFRGELRRRGHDPDAEALFPPPRAPRDILHRASGERYATNRASNKLAQLHVPGLSKCDRGGGSGGRGWTWRGPDAPDDAPTVGVKRPPPEPRD